MKRSKVFLCLLCAGMMWTPNAFAVQTQPSQLAAAAPDDQEISGSVEDASGPMVGATVKVVGTNNGTVTDLNGKFKLRCKPGATLEVSYVGYTTKTVKAQQGMKIMLDEA